MGVMKEKLEKIDKSVIGVIVGALLPIIGFFISYVVKTYSSGISFEEYVNIAVNDNYAKDRQDIMIFSMIPNMLLFYFTNFRWGIYEFTKGLVAVTLLLGVALFIISY